MNELIAIVEDEGDIRSIVATALKREGFRVRESADGASFLSSLAGETPALVVLDVMLPDLDGFAICGKLRKDPALAAISVVMLTARAGEADRVRGLDLGADDYVVKPFSPKELVARVKAVLRRSAASARVPFATGDPIAVEAFEAFLDGRPLDLTRAEFHLLQLLASRPGWAFSREQILAHLWGDEKTVTDRSVDVHVAHLRDKLGAEGHRIANVRGVGYRLTEPRGSEGRQG